MVSGATSGGGMYFQSILHVLSSSFLEPIFFPRKDFISSRNLIIAILGKKEKDNVDL